MTEFERFTKSYRDELDEALAFSGADGDFFIRAKAGLLADLARRRLGDPSRLEALDVGCGPGETDRHLEGTFADLHGVDVEPGMITEAAANNPWAHYQRSSGTELPFDSGRFDLAFTICVLHHVPPAHWDPFVAEMARVVKPGGLVAIFEHNPLNPLTRRVVRDCAFDERVVLLRRREATRLLRAQGLEPAEARYILFFPRERRWLRAIERGLTWAPLGAQYYTAARTPGGETADGMLRP